MIYNFTLPDYNGEEFKFENLKGKWIVLYFYPKDDTPGCTIEAKDFSNLINEFEKEECYVIGVSKDSTQSHLKFKTKYNLKVILISDSKEILHKYLNVRNRSTFLFNPEGKLIKEWRGVNPINHANEVLDYLRKIKQSI